MQSKYNNSFRLLLFPLLFLFSVSVFEAQSTTPILDAIVQRDILRCGIAGNNLGFSSSLGGETYTGFDVDLCRAVASAVLGDADKVSFEILSSDSFERKNAISADCQSKCVDLLTLNVTWTMSREVDWDATFAPSTFYDGQDIMVLAESGIQTIEDLRGSVVCATGEGTTTVTNLRDIEQRYDFTLRVIESGRFIDVYEELIRGRCSAISSDSSELISYRGWSQLLSDYAVSPSDDGFIQLPLEFQDLIANWWYFPTANDLRILNAQVDGRPLSEEPLGLVSSQRDPVFADVIRWTIYGLLHAENLGISRANFDLETCQPRLEVFEESQRNDINALFSSIDDIFDENANDLFKRDFLRQVICQVGNYEDIYNRNLGPGTILNLDRSQTRNLLWTDGGLLYAPPY